MSEDFFDEFIGSSGEQDDEASMPEGGSLVQTPFIGPAMAVMRWKLGSNIDLEDFEGVPEYTKTTFSSGWNQYYFDSKAKADAAQALLEEGYVEQIWLWQMDANLVLNATSETFAERWGGVVSTECRITSLNSWKRRHEFHMMTLPSFVQAMAQRLGYIGSEVRLFHLDEIMAEDTKFTDEFELGLIGPTGRPDKGHANDYQDSILWKRRAELWAALGEENPEAYAQMDAQHKFATTSDKLSRILSALRTQVWRKPLWVRLMLIDDPKADAVSGSGRRITRPYIMEIFPTEADAHKAALEEAPDLPKQEEIPFDAPPAEEAAEPADMASEAAAPSDAPSVPSAWADYPESWKEELAKRKEQFDGKMPPPPVIKQLAAELEVEAGSVRAWWGFV